MRKKEVLWRTQQKQNLILTGYDDVIDKLKSMPEKQLTTTQRKEIHQMLKDIDKTNIGAIKNVNKAIERLQTKKNWRV